jgi:undecaprenyl-diphosphatase
MNNYLNLILRSIIESITEFLPISSTGHLFLFTSFFPFDVEDGASFDDLFDIFIQSGAILSVLVLYRKFLFEKTKDTFQFMLRQTSDNSGFHFFTNIAIGSLPVLVFGFAFKSILDTIKASEYLLFILGFSWLAGGIAIVLVEKKLEAMISNTAAVTTSLSFRQSIIIGTCQCLALIPGMSRSAMTIITARLLGLPKKTAAEYSFFLAIPVLIAASLYKLYKYRALLHGDTLYLLAIGFILTFILCMFIIKWFLAFIQKNSFSSFGYYRILLGVIVISYYLFTIFRS